MDRQATGEGERSIFLCSCGASPFRGLTGFVDEDPSLTLRMTRDGDQDDKGDEM